ncbi:MAG: hypothetical protein JSS49_23975 [Planctomycetes bacterium]|nr:hypothetical protein [Planctomycetota bacterium]
MGDQVPTIRFHWELLALCLLAAGSPGCGGAKPSPQHVESPAPPARPLLEKPTAPGAESITKQTSAPAENSSDSPANPSNVQPTKPEPILRPADQRPHHDDRRLAELGIRLYESTRLKLYTDIDPAVAATLPPVIDQAYQALVDYFGPLAPDRARSEFQMTGYLIKDDVLFREVGLIPEDLPPFEHGRHRRNEFWMREQKYDYYRRHLLIHEVTHCFMTVMPDVDAPVWYMEGMAECFGTHRTAPDGTIQFRVMPTSPEEFAGSGRITAIRNDYAAGRARSIPDILDLQPIEFLKTEHYAWSWGLCTFLDHTPHFQERFRKLGGYLQRNAFPTQFIRDFGLDSRDLATEWTLFVQNLQYGYDIQRSAIEFVPGKKLDSSRPRHEARIQADRGWQSSGVLMEFGREYRVAATGQFELAAVPKPWISEPQGISFQYFEGAPLGLLVGAMRAEEGETGGAADSMLKVYPMGRGGTFTAPSSGTLYLRVNDAWNSLADNKGQVTVEINAAEPE